MSQREVIMKKGNVSRIFSLSNYIPKLNVMVQVIYCYPFKLRAECTLKIYFDGKSSMKEMLELCMLGVNYKVRQFLLSGFFSK